MFEIVQRVSFENRSAFKSSIILLCHRRPMDPECETFFHGSEILFWRIRISSDVQQEDAQNPDTLMRPNQLAKDCGEALLHYRYHKE